MNAISIFIHKVNGEKVKLQFVPNNHLKNYYSEKNHVFRTFLKLL